MNSRFNGRYAKEFLWLDLRARKLVAPPVALLATMQQVPRAPGFSELPAAERSVST